MHTFFLISLLSLLTLPLRAATAEPISDAETIIDAAQYGLSPEAADNTAAWRQAVAACHQVKNPRLVLTAGVYRFDSAVLAPTLSQWKDLSHLTIDGNGAQFLITGAPRQMDLFRFERCRDVQISRLTIDTQTLPHAQGRILSFDGERIEIELDSRFPLQPVVPVESIVDCDSETGLILANIDLYQSAIASIERPENGPVIVRLKKTVDGGDANRRMELEKLKGILPGEKVILRQSTYGGFAFNFNSSNDINLRHVTIHSYPGMGLHARLCGNIALDDFTIAPPTGSDRLLSTTKDGLHFTHNFGFIRVENSFFDATGDDAFNVYAKYRNIKRVTQKNEFEMIFDRNRGWQGPTPEPSEVLDFWAADSMNPKGSATVSAAIWNPATKTFTVKFQSPLPDSLAPADWVSSQKYLPRVEVRQTRFRGMLGRAAVFSTSHVLMENCTVEATAYSGILLTAGSRHERQGPATRNLVLRHNRFDGTGGAAIFGYVYTPAPGTEAQCQIRIEDNRITDNPALAQRRLKTRHPDWLHWSAGICLIGASQVSLIDNQFTGYPIACYLDRVDTVTFSGNKSPTPAKTIINHLSGSFVEQKNGRIAIERDEQTYDADLRYLGIIR